MTALEPGGLPRIPAAPVPGQAAPPAQSLERLVAFAESLLAGFDEAWGRMPLGIVRNVGGARLDIRTTLPEQLEVFRHAIAHGRADGGRPARILVACGGTAGLPLAPVWGSWHLHERAVEAALAGTSLRIHHRPEERFWQVHDLATGRGVQLLAAPDALPPWDDGAPLRNFLKWHLTDAGTGLLHAGTLAVDGRGILLFGPGGSGKSGTVLAGLGHGLQSVGDDYVLVRLGGRVTAEPLFSILKSDPAGLERAGLRGERFEGPLNWQGKRRIPMGAVTGEPQPESIGLVAIVRPVVTGGGRTTLEPMGAREAFVGLAPTGVAQLPGDRDRNFAFCAEATRRLPAFRLRLGTDPAEIAGAIRAFLAEGAGTC